MLAISRSLSATGSGMWASKRTEDLATWEIFPKSVLLSFVSSAIRL